MTKIVLIGYMGSGKSTLGKMLSSSISTNFVDLDTAIEKTANMPITEIFAKKGEIYFRKKEQQVLMELLQNDDSFVIALGGGTPCYGTVMKVLRENQLVTSFYLRAGVATLAERLFTEKETRPLLSHLNTKEALNDFIRKHLFERSYYYNQATHTIAIDNKTKLEIVLEMVGHLF